MRKKQSSKIEKERVLEKIQLYKETINEQDDYSGHLNKLILDKDKEIQKLESKIQTLINKQEKELYTILNPVLKKFLKDRTAVKEKEHEMQELHLKIESIEETHKEMIQSLEEEHKKEIEKYENILRKERKTIGEFKSSISYPIYQMSSSMGRTQLGKVLQKLLK